MPRIATSPVTTVIHPVRTATLRARISPHRTRRHARTVQLLAGLVAVGTGVALQIRADLGVASWDVLHVGLAERTGASVGTVSMVVSLGAIAVSALLKERPRPGTVVPVLVVAPTIDLVLALVDTPHGPSGQVAMLVAGTLLMAVGVGAYVTSDHGAGPGDLVFLGVAKLGIPVSAARFLVDGVAVAAGWALGGPVGVGTVVVTLGLGPLVGVAIDVFDLAPSRLEVARRTRVFHQQVARELHLELEGV